MVEQFPIKRIESERIDSEVLENAICLIFAEDIFPDDRIVAKYLHIAIRDTWRPTRALRDGSNRLRIFDRMIECQKRTMDNLFYLILSIEVELQNIPESITKRTRQI